MAVTMKITVFWGVTSCSLIVIFVKLGQSTRSHILEKVMLMVIPEIISYQVSPNLRYSATLTIQAVGISETMVNFYQARGLHNTQTFLITTKQLLHVSVQSPSSGSVLLELTKVIVVKIIS
jgi:hypothetical protein